MKRIFKQTISLLLVITMLITSAASVFAQEQKPNVPKYNLATLEVFDYALLAIGDNMPVAMNSAIATINANVYSNGDFKFKGSQLMLNGECNVAGKIMKESNYANIQKPLENVVKTHVKNYVNEVEALVSPKAKVLPNSVIYHGNSTVIPPETATDAVVEVETATDSAVKVDEIFLHGNTMTFDEDMIIKGDFTVNVPILNLSNYIIAEGDIVLNTSLIRTTLDKPLILVSKTGNITINSSSDTFNGIIYAPNGAVNVNTTSFSLNGKIIANQIKMASSSCTIGDSEFAIEWMRTLTDEDKDDDGLNDEYERKCLLPRLLLQGVKINGIENINPLDDFDGEGLNYLQEYEYDTNPFLADTDGDGLSDYDEIFVYHTNPNMIDTDCDEMNDGTEVNCGLNPLEEDSDGDGVLDCEEITTQKVNFVENQEEMSVTIPQAIITGKGDYSAQLKIEDVSYNETFSDIESIVGHPFEFAHEEDFTFEKATMRFQIEESILRQTSLENLAIAWYDYEKNDLVLLDTKHDTQTNEISAELDHFSTYMVIDQQKYYDSQFSTVEQSQYFSGMVRTTLPSKTAYKVTSSYLTQKWSKVNTSEIDYAKDIVANRNTLFLLSDWSNEQDKDLQEANLEYLKFCEEVDRRGYKFTFGVNGYSENQNSLGFNLRGLFPYHNSLDIYLFPYHHDGKDSTYGFIYGLDAVKGYSKNYPFFFDPEYHTDVVIMSYNTSMQVTTNPKRREMLENALAWYKQHNITISVVGNPNTFSAYENIVSETGGVFADINGDFSKDLEPLMTRMIQSNDDGNLVHLSNGTIVRLDANPSKGDWTIDSDEDGIADLNELVEPTIKEVYNRQTKRSEYQEVWTFLSNPAKQDTDGDGLKDMEDMYPTQYNALITENNDTEIRFNSGRIWTKFNYSVDVYLGALAGVAFTGGGVGGGISPEFAQAQERLSIIQQASMKNEKINFSIEELTMVAALNSSGALLYLNTKTDADREKVFYQCTGKKPLFFRHNPDGSYEKVNAYSDGGFFQGKVFSEADFSFSLKPYSNYDFIDVANAAMVVGIVVTSAILIVEVAPVITNNIKSLAYMWKTYGFEYTKLLYQTIGPNGIISYVQMDMMDGDFEIIKISKMLTEILQKDIEDGDTVLDDIPQADLVNKFANSIGKKALHRKEADILVLGKYLGEKDVNSYQNVAKNVSGSHYNIPQSVWTDLNEKYGDEFMWLCNKRALEYQLQKTKEVIFTVNPLSYPNTATHKEYLLIKELYPNLKLEEIDGFFKFILR